MDLTRRSRNRTSAQSVLQKGTKETKSTITQGSLFPSVKFRKLNMHVACSGIVSRSDTNEKRLLLRGHQTVIAATLCPWICSLRLRVHSCPFVGLYFMSPAQAGSENQPRSEPCGARRRSSSSSRRPALPRLSVAAVCHAGGMPRCARGEFSPLFCDLCGSLCGYSGGKCVSVPGWRKVLPLHAFACRRSRVCAALRAACARAFGPRLRAA